MEKVSEALAKGFRILYYVEVNGEPEVQAYLRQPSNPAVKLKFLLSKANIFLETLKQNVGNDVAFPDFEAKYPNLLQSMTPILCSKKIGPRPFYEELVKCEDTIYLDEKSLYLDVQFVLTMGFFPEEAGNLYYGQDEYMSYNTFWIMGPTLFDRNNAIHIQLQSIFHSGIFEKIGRTVDAEWYQIQMKIRKVLVKQGLQTKPLSWTSGLLNGVFIFLAVGIGVSVCAIVLEILMRNKIVKLTLMNMIQS